MAVLELKINGKKETIDTDPRTPLLWVLRDELGLTGAKYGCGEGQCGACTVLVDDRAMQSCLFPVSDAVGKTITTIEGLSDGDNLHPIQQAFLDAGAFQCGFCTPGMIMAAAALLGDDPSPSVEATRERLDGNICRCGTYPRIVEAVRRAGKAVSHG